MSGIQLGWDSNGLGSRVDRVLFLITNTTLWQLGGRVFFAGEALSR